VDLGDSRLALAMLRLRLDFQADYLESLSLCVLYNKPRAFNRRPFTREVKGKNQCFLRNPGEGAELDVNCPHPLTAMARQFFFCDLNNVYSDGKLVHVASLIVLLAFAGGIENALCKEVRHCRLVPGSLRKRVLQHLVFAIEDDLANVR